MDEKNINLPEPVIKNLFDKYIWENNEIILDHKKKEIKVEMN